MAAGEEIAVHQRVGIVDPPDSRDRVHAQMRAYQKRLGVRVADTADPGVSVEFGQIAVKFGPERRIFNTVNLPLEPPRRIVKRHTAPAGPQMGVVIHSEKNVQHAVPF